MLNLKVTGNLFGSTNRLMQLYLKMRHLHSITNTGKEILKVVLNYTRIICYFLIFKLNILLVTFTKMLFFSNYK